MILFFRIMYNNIGNIVTLLCPNYTPKEPLLDSKSYKSLVYIKLHKIKHEHSSQEFTMIVFGNTHDRSIGLFVVSIKFVL